MRSSLSGLGLILGLLGTASPAAAQAVLYERGIVAASDGQLGDGYASSIDAADGWMAAGAPHHGTGGAVYVVRRAVLLDEIKILPGHPDAALFGFKVALEPGRLAVGDPGFDDNRGRVDLYEREGQNWVHEGFFEGSQPGEEFGYDIALDLASGHLAIAAPNADGRGRVALYRAVGGSWVQEVSLSWPFGPVGQRFAHSLGLSGDRLSVGVPGYETSRGRVANYAWNGIQWSTSGSLSRPESLPEDYFGLVLALDGDHLLIGAPGHDSVADDAGAAYLYQHDGAGWTAPLKLEDPEGAAEDLFGIGVALRDGVACVSAPYHDELFDSNVGTVRQWRLRQSKWHAQHVFEPYFTTSGSYHGQALALDEGELLVGAPQRNVGGIKRGAMLQFETADFGLGVEPRYANLGNTVHLDHYAGEPSQPVLLFVESIDGQLLNLKLSTSVFDGDGGLHLQGPHDNPALSGLELGFRSYALGPGATLEVSNAIYLKLL